MSGINKVILVGHLGKDPEVRYLEGGVSVTSFPLATSENYNKDGRKVEQTEWHNIVLWRGLAELAQKHLHKGSLIYLEGRIRTRNWEDKDKNRRSSTEITGDNLVMLDKRKEQSEQGAENATIPDMNFEAGNMHKDDLPF